MEIQANCPTKEFTCATVILQAPQPFDEGHECTGQEAGALNQLLVENSRNNFATTCKKMQEAGDDGATIQKAYDGHISGYDFGVRRGRMAILDPVEREAYNMAKVRVLEVLRKKGTNMKELDADTLNTYVQNALDKYPQFRESAQAIVDQRTALDAELEL